MNDFNPTHLHTDHKTEYELLFIANQKSQRKSDFMPTAVYKDKTGNLWARPLPDFQTKFERL